MKKINALAMVAFLVVFTTNLNAQTVFKVLARSGSVFAVTGTNNKTALVTGMPLTANQSLEIEGSGFVGLMHSASGRTIELKQAGTFTVAQLDKDVKAKGTANLNQKYASYVFNKLTEGEGGKVQDANHQDYMAVTGSVERDITGNSIRVYLPNTSEAFGSQATIYWSPAKGAKEYLVVVTNMFDKEIYNFTTTTTEAKIDIAKMAEKSKDGDLAEPEFFITVYDKNNKALHSKKHLIKVMEPGKAKKVEKELASLKSETEGNSSMSRVILGAFYEHHDLYIDAMEQYQNAKKMEPEVVEYDRILTRFVHRIGANVRNF